MSVIVFAPPQASLPAQAREVATLVNNFDHPLLAQTEDDLQRCIEVANDNIVGLWFVGHSSAAGLVVGEQTMTPATLGQYLSTAGVEWSFYNSCESAMFIEQLQKSHDHDCYANITEVNDTSAWRTAALVAAKYANVGDIHRAVRLAAPPGSTPLRFFPSPSNRGDMSNRGSFNREDSAAGNRLPDQIGKLTEAIYELRNQIAMLNRDLTAHDKRLERLESSSDGRHTVDGNNNRLMLGVLVAIAVMMAIFLIAASTGALR